MRPCVDDSPINEQPLGQESAPERSCRSRLPTPTCHVTAESALAPVAVQVMTFCGNRNFPAGLCRCRPPLTPQCRSEPGTISKPSLCVVRETHVCTRSIPVHSTTVHRARHVPV